MTIAKQREILEENLVGFFLHEKCDEEENLFTSKATDKHTPNATT